MSKIIGKLKDKVRGLKGTSSTNLDVESDEMEEQHEKLEPPSIKEAEEEPRKLVVVGKESVFSKDIIDFAIGMAERMSYEIVALNAAPLSCDTFNISSSREQICNDFKLLSEKNVQPFKEEAEKRNIRFFHVIKFSESYEVLAELKKEIGEFEFVVSEEEDNGATNPDSKETSSRPKIFVYSMI